MSKQTAPEATLINFKEYAFDVKLVAVVRLNAKTERGAREQLSMALDCVAGPSVDGANVTAFSLEVDDINGPCLFEVDGEDVPRR